MSPFSYDSACVVVPDRIASAHREAWQRLARPGSWWNGAERVAIAHALRDAPACRLCTERKSALSPAAIDGEHDASPDARALPATAIDAVHRIATDNARLSRTWLEKSFAEGLSDGQYVELIGVVVAVLSIDEFHRALGVALEPLPQPEAGEPSRYRPTQATAGDAWVPMLPMGGATGEESDLWLPGRSANVIRALSLVPDAVRQLKDLSGAHYLTMDEMTNLRIKRGLERAQMELIAGRVSAVNECFY